MTLTELMNEYDQKCEGMLDAGEQSVYISLVLIWNRLRRPEWFPVSRKELMHKAGVGDPKRVDRLRLSLEKKGFIETIPTGRTTPRKYQLKPLPTRGAEPLDTRGREPLTRGAEPLDQNPLGAENPQHWGQRTPKLGAHSPTSQRESYTENERSLSSTVSNLEMHRPPEREAPPLPDYVWEKYLTYREPKDRENERAQLAIWTEEEGTKAVMEAIEKGIQAGGKSINYIGSILHNGGDNGKGRAKRTTRQLTEEEEAAKWERAIARQREFEEEQRRKHGEGWNL